MKLSLAGYIAVSLGALLPFITASHLFYGSINAKFFFVVCVALTLLGVFAWRVATDTTLVLVKKQLLLLGMLFFGGVQVLTAWFGIYPERSFFSDIFWSSGVLFLAHCALIAYLFSVLLTTHDWVRVRQTVLIGAGVFALIAMIGANGLGFEGKFLWISLKDWGLSFGNETYAGAYLLLAVLFALPEVLKKGVGKHLRMTLIGALVLVGLSPFLFNTGLLLGKTPLLDVFSSPQLLLGISRASSATFFLLIGFIGAHLFFKRFLKGKIAGKATVALGVALLLIVTGVVSQLFVSGSAIQNAYIKESTAARIIVWEQGMKAFAERPVLGWGPENFNFALEKYFDNRLFLEENYGEIWFERAHNVFIDTLVTTGTLGLVALVGFYSLLVYTAWRARRKGLLNDTEAVVLMSIAPAHLLQLQTGFDTIASYTLFAVIIGYLLSLERESAPALSFAITKHVRSGVALGAVLLIVMSVSLYLLPEWGRQEALAKTFTGKTLAEQQAYAKKSLERLSSFETLRMSSASFIQGSLAILAKDASKERVSMILNFADMYETRLEQYVEANPEHYRARVNLAYLYLIETSLGENKLEEARGVLARAKALSPENPITPILLSAVELYDENPEGARMYMDEALALNPDLEFTKQADSYLKEQLTHPQNITVLKLINL